MTREQQKQAEHVLSFYSDGQSLIRYFHFRAFKVPSDKKYPCGICSESGRGDDICPRCFATFAPLSGVVPVELTRLVCLRLDETGDGHRAELLRRLCPEEMPKSYLAEAREKLGLTQAELARKLGIAPRTVIRIESDCSKRLSDRHDGLLRQLLRAHRKAA